MPLSGMLTCGSCGARTPMNSMRYNLSGNKLICPGCVDKERSSIKPGTTASVRLRSTPSRSAVSIEEAGTGQPSQSVGMASYYCRSCQFRFARKKGMEVTACPYCGRQNIAQAYEGRAQDLIEEAGAAREEEF